MTRSILWSSLLVAMACAPKVAPPPAPTAHAPRRVDSIPVTATAVPAAKAVPVAPPVATKSVPRATGTTSATPATPADPFARFDATTWPAPNRYRSAGGQPGPDYWQQRADYDIAVTLDTSARTVGGRVTITYTNNSPDTLTFVWLQLDQNLYEPGSLGAVVHSEQTRWSALGFRGGFEIRALTVNGRSVIAAVDDTRMRLKLPTALAPHGGRVSIAMEYSFRIPEHGSDRMGRDGQLYEIAQWYPRMAVYDDLRGWNTDPYYGQGEFYLEYGDITYAVTAPAGYTIAGSGVLQNATEVLSATERARLSDAAKTERTVAIIAAGEDRAFPVAGTKTWRFAATNVRDVAWAGAPDFRWDATSWNGILLQAFYERAKAGPSWERAAEWTRWSVRFYSQLVMRYPYPQATSVAGPVGGMEYPMFVMVHYGRSAKDSAEVFGTIDHEQGHEWFPMVVGSDERRYAWMDEGMDTYLNAFSEEAHGPDSTRWAEYVGEWGAVAANGTQSPVMTPADRIGAGAYGAIAYRKPGAVLLALRDHVVGPSTFDEAIREYARRWAFKHPAPWDFFRTVENVSGEDLAWFWRGFFYSDEVLDVGVDSAFTVTTREGLQAIVRLTRHTSVPFPVEMRLKLDDGSVRDLALPVEIWFGGDRYEAIVAVDSPVRGVRLWPDATVPDFNAANDTWGDAPAGETRRRVTAGGLASPLTVNP